MLGEQVSPILKNTENCRKSISFFYSSHRHYIVASDKKRDEQCVNRSKKAGAHRLGYRRLEFTRVSLGGSHRAFCALIGAWCPPASPTPPLPPSRPHSKALPLPPPSLFFFMTKISPTKHPEQGFKVAFAHLLPAFV